MDFPSRESPSNLPLGGENKSSASLYDILATPNAMINNEFKISLMAPERKRPSCRELINKIAVKVNLSSELDILRFTSLTRFILVYSKIMIEMSTKFN